MDGLPLDENASCLMESNNDVEGEGLHRQIKTKKSFPTFLLEAPRFILGWEHGSRKFIYQKFRGVLIAITT